MALLLIANVIAALAALSQAVTGFGFALVLVPLLSFFFDPKLVVVISLSLGLVCKIPLLLRCWRDIHLEQMALVSATAMVGALLGTRILLSADPNVMRVVIGIVVILLSIPMLFRDRAPAEARAGGVWRRRAGQRHHQRRDEHGRTARRPARSQPVVAQGALPSEPARLLHGDQHVDDRATAAVRAIWAERRSSGMRGCCPGLVVGLIAGSYLFGRIPTEPFREAVVMLVIGTALGRAWGRGSIVCSPDRAPRLD